jgi:hypothetical protein
MGTALDGHENLFSQLAQRIDGVCGAGASLRSTYCCVLDLSLVDRVCGDE